MVLRTVPWLSVCRRSATSFFCNQRRLLVVDRMIGYDFRFSLKIIIVVFLADRKQALFADHRRPGSQNIDIRSHAKHVSEVLC